MLLKELKVPLQGTPLIRYDNLSAISFTSNPILHTRTKHIELDYHFIWVKAVQKLIWVHHD